MHRLTTHLRNRVHFNIFLWVFLCVTVTDPDAFALSFNIPFGSLTNHNTSAYPAYNQANFSANFGTTTWVNQNGTTVPIDPSQMDESLNPVTPGHVSKMDVHTLIPSRPDLRWFAHATPWFGSSSHINIGLTNNSTAYVASMITDMKNRGFNGVIIDWYGQGDGTDGVVQKIKSYLAGIPGNTFTYIIMIDKGVRGGTGTNNLLTQIQYCQSQYFSDPNYEREPVSTGNPILMFFGVRSTLSATDMSNVKASAGGNMVWVEQGTSYLGESWEDECFEWTDCFTSGVNPSDPFNLSAVTGDYSTIKNSGKKAFGAMCSQFDGTLTKSVGWSMGKYLPSSNGLCLVSRAASINSAIFNNMTRMQWATWSDWEEGTEVEDGIENGFSVAAQVTSNIVSWAVNSGDERTIDHYEVYAVTNGGNTALVCSVNAGAHQTNISTAGFAPGIYNLYVDAVGKPCVRDHMSAPVLYAVSTLPVINSDLQPLLQTVWQTDPVTFAVTAGGSPPFGYQWMLNGQPVSGATNSSYTFSALAGTNDYAVTVSNSLGSVNSSTAIVVGEPITVINPANYHEMQITFSGYTNTETLSDFPVLVRLSPGIPGFSYSQFLFPGTGADLRFVSASGRELPFQIDEWNSAGESTVWVQVPSITSSNDYIIACWGNPADVAMLPCNTNGTAWSTLNGADDFQLVYHLNQAGLPFQDSTLGFPATSGVSPSSTAGIVGKGCLFNGTSQFLDPGIIHIGKTFTVSAWVNIASTANSEQTLWCNKSGGWSVAGFDFYVNSYQANDGVIYFDTADGVGGNVSARTVTHAVSFGQWHQLTGTMDGINGAVHVYIDGLDQTINTGVDTAFQVTNYCRCGSLLTGTPGSGGNQYFNGTMDETRIENTVRSPAWVWASWATVAESSFVTYGTIAPPATLSAQQQAGGQVTLSWSTGILQSGPTPSGPFTNVTTAPSPFTVTPSVPQQYFRIKVQ